MLSISFCSFVKVIYFFILFFKSYIFGSVLYIFFNPKNAQFTTLFNSHCHYFLGLGKTDTQYFYFYMVINRYKNVNMSFIDMKRIIIIIVISYIRKAITKVYYRHSKLGFTQKQILIWKFLSGYKKQYSGLLLFEMFIFKS